MWFYKQRSNTVSVYPHNFVLVGVRTNHLFLCFTEYDVFCLLLSGAALCDLVPDTGHVSTTWSRWGRCLCLPLLLILIPSIVQLNAESRAAVSTAEERAVDGMDSRGQLCVTNFLMLAQTFTGWIRYLCSLYPAHRLYVANLLLYWIFPEILMMLNNSFDKWIYSSDVNISSTASHVYLSDFIWVSELTCLFRPYCSCLPKMCIVF